MPGLSDCAEVDAMVRRHEEHEHRIGMGPPLLMLVRLAASPTTAPTTAPQVSTAAPYVRPLASLKTLYSDFVVRERCPLYRHAEPLRLERDLQLPVKPSQVPSGEAKRAREEQTAELDVPMSDKLDAAFGTLLTADDLAQLKMAVQAGTERVVLGGIYDKARRTAVHQAVRACLGATHVSGTTAATTEGEDDGNHDGSGHVFIATANAADRRAQRRRAQPRRQPVFLHFTLYKENLDSNQVFRRLARSLRVPTRQLLFSGTKDKRAVTLQRVALRDGDARQVARLVNGDDATHTAPLSFGPQGRVRVCGFCYEPCGLRLGDATGNHFTIALRLRRGTPCPTPAQLTAVAALLGEVGAVNYYGAQRFGTTRVLTSDVGVALLQGRFAAATELLFASKACIVPEMQSVVSFVAAQDYAAALAHTPHYCLQERDVLQHLVRSPNDHQGAFRVLPRTLAMLFFHAVQSLLWNTMAARRLSNAARLCVEVGDLVLASTYERRTSGTCCQSPQGGTTGERKAGADTIDTTSEAVPDDEAEALPAVHTLQAEDDLARFTLADVVLPVPGPDTGLQYPQSSGCTYADYVAAMREMGVDKALLDPTSALVNVYHYHGTYRALCVRPEKVKLGVCKAVSWHTPVFSTDLERQQETPTTQAEAAKDDDDGRDEDNDAVDVLTAAFALPPGSYATCVLRELVVVCGDDMHHTKSPRETPTECDAADALIDE